MVKAQLRMRLELSNQLYLDLLSHIPEEFLSSKLRPLPSNTIGEQIWCVIGARDSYLRAAKAGDWLGFECPLDPSQVTDARAVRDVLISTTKALSEFLAAPDELSESSLKFMLDLLEHEAQHHGQIARYLYGMKLGVPDSWKKRYNFD